jgi:predicted nuclease of predicted toxin-antitoxin system
MTDSEVFRKAATEKRVLLTFDLDFGEILALSRESTVSVVLFRLHNTRTPHVIEHLQAKRSARRLFQIRVLVRIRRRAATEKA